MSQNIKDNPETEISSTPDLSTVSRYNLSTIFQPRTNVIRSSRLRSSPLRALRSAHCFYILSSYRRRSTARRVRRSVLVERPGVYLDAVPIRLVNR